MDVVALLDELGSLPGARRAPAVAGLEQVVVVSGIEVARARISGESALRRAYRERHRGGATPLLLLGDDAARAGAVAALGPVDAAGPVRTIDAGSLQRVLERVSSLPRLAAVRELAAELDRLDQSGIPGLKVSELLSLHALDVRLRADRDRWPALTAASAGVPASPEWRQTLEALGYTLHRRPTPQRGWLLRHAGRPVAVVHGKADPSEFTRLDPEGRPPEGLLLKDCAAEACDYGLLASHTRLRLFDAGGRTPGSSSRWIEIDPAALRPEDRPFVGLLAPWALAEGGLAALVADARTFGAGLRKRLDERIRQDVLPVLGRALGRWARAEGLDPDDEGVRVELERAALTLVFRALFVLYAEAAGHLPIAHPGYRAVALSELVREAEEADAAFDPRSSALWSRFAVLVETLHSGDRRSGVPAYNGALFARDGFEGAGTLARCKLPDDVFGPVLLGLGHDAQTGRGIDYSTLEIGHLGHVYEGLLSLRLAVADRPLSYNRRADAYEPADGDSAEMAAGDLLWQTHQGGRKGGGVYYTPAPLVRHIVRSAVVPAFRRHLEAVRALADTDPAAAADLLFAFAVLDPACGSAHFLVEVVRVLTDELTLFLAEVPLPGVTAALERLVAGAAPGVAIEAAELRRRLVLKRCVFGVDLSPMGAEVAKLSLWLAAFVPGLSLSYLDRNIQVGNALVGVAQPTALRWDPAQPTFFEDALQAAIAEAGAAVAKVAEGDDRNPDEYAGSQAADLEARQATARLADLFNLWTAEAFGLPGARSHVDSHGKAVLAGDRDPLVARATEVAQRERFLHWPLAFPLVMARGGFDAVIGNPPWNEVTVEEASFWALFRPGIRRGVSDTERRRVIAELVAERPDLTERLAADKAAAATLRGYFRTGEYRAGSGDPDLYRFFCQRYRTVLGDGGALGVVLPRTAFVNEGSSEFREWLLTANTTDRLDFLINAGRWAFDSEPRYTVALVAARGHPPPSGHRVRIAGPATSAAAWEVQAGGPGIALAASAYGPDRTVPLLRDQREADLLAKLRVGERFPFGAGGRWRCFPVAELHETNDKGFWDGATTGDPLWKGESFDQYDPHGRGARHVPDTPELHRKLAKPRPGAGSLLARDAARGLPVDVRRQAVRSELDRARLVFTDVTQKDNSRTVVAALIPPGVRVTNKAPYLAFVTGGEIARAACLGVMNSLPFDWQARRFVEINLNFFILEGLIVPDLSDHDFAAVAAAAARLSCVDERFADFAAACGVACGPLGDDERLRLRAEIDARVARAWNLTTADLDVLLADFTTSAVTPAHRAALRDRLQELREP